MEKKQRFFIYDRKEVSLLVLLGLMVAIFAFTLGVHLGKRVGPKGQIVTENRPGAPISEVHEAVPSEKELQEKAKAKNPATDELLDQATHDEVTRTGIKLDETRQVDLPKETRSVNAGATTEVADEEEKSPVPAKAENSAPTHTKAQLSGAQSRAKHRFVLQVGSYPAILVAQEKVHALEATGLKPTIHTAQVEGTTRYRIFVGDFDTKAEAQKAGLLYQQQKKIESFIVARSAE